jgi:hypothetical protein
MDLGHDKFPWTFFTLIAVAGAVALIRHWSGRGFEVIVSPEWCAPIGMSGVPDHIPPPGLP